MQETQDKTLTRYDIRLEEWTERYSGDSSVWVKSDSAVKRWKKSKKKSPLSDYYSPLELAFALSTNYLTYEEKRGIYAELRSNGDKFSLETLRADGRLVRIQNEIQPNLRSILEQLKIQYEKILDLFDQRVLVRALHNKEIIIREIVEDTKILEDISNSSPSQISPKINEKLAEVRESILDILAEGEFRDREYNELTERSREWILFDEGGYSVNDKGFHGKLNERRVNVSNLLAEVRGLIIPLEKFLLETNLVELVDVRVITLIELIKNPIALPRFNMKPTLPEYLLEKRGEFEPEIKKRLNGRGLIPNYYNTSPNTWILEHYRKYFSTI